MFRNKEELERLSEFGVLFLLFEMGLELSVDRLKVSSLQRCKRVVHHALWPLASWPEHATAVSVPQLLSVLQLRRPGRHFTSCFANCIYSRCSLT